MYLYAEDGVAAGYLSQSGKEIQCCSRSYCALWMWGQHLFTWAGEHVGFYVDGWVRDPDGRAIACTEQASGGPKKPLIQPLPQKRASGQPGKMPTRGTVPPKPEWLNEWSPVSAHEFFVLFVDEDGASVANGAGGFLFRTARDRVLATRPAPEPAATPEPVVEAAAEADGDAVLIALNDAIRAYAAAKDDGNVRLALHRLAQAAATWARERGTDLRS